MTGTDGTLHRGAQGHGPHGAERAGSRPAVFLDKDGTLLRDVPFNVDPARMAWAPGAARGLRLLARTGWPLVVITNQPGIARGRFDHAALQRVRCHLAAMFAACGATLEGFHYCPHAARARVPCLCRKPREGMLRAAAAELDLALDASWMVGDILDDVEAGHRAGCRSILIDNGNETLWEDGPLRRPDWRVPDLHAAARIIVAAAAGPALPPESPEAGPQARPTGLARSAGLATPTLPASPAKSSALPGAAMEQGA